MKKLLLLGGSRYLIPAIKAAHDLGIYVITADYLPDNVAHRHSDEYRNISIIDKSSVLAVAKEINVDGILSFATDPGVTTAAFVAERLGLPTSPLKSVEILQNKAKFRSFMRDNGFNTPFTMNFSSIEDMLSNIESDIFPVMVKPVDSAGSKGVSKVDNKNELIEAAKNALTFSSIGEYIVEEYIEKQGSSSGADCFSIDGELRCCSFTNQRFDETSPNTYAPTGNSWPSSMPIHVQQELRSELQRLIKILNMGTTIYNIETRWGTDGKAYIMECSPRAGGNRLAEVLKLASGQDLIRASIQAGMGMPIDKALTDPVYNGYWGTMILHSNNGGIFRSLHIEESFRKNYVVEIDLWVKVGDEVRSFTGANESIGSLILHCKNRDELKWAFDHADKLVSVEVY